MRKSMQTNRDVAERWASQALGVSYTKHMSQEDRDVFSYRAHIGHILSNENGRIVALITARDYSYTTKRHKSLLRRACYARGIPYWEVPYLTPYDRADNAANVAYLERLVHDEEQRIKRARIYKGTDKLDRLRGELASYREAFPDLPIS